jgi:hypothetical protein
MIYARVFVSVLEHKKPGNWSRGSKATDNCLWIDADDLIRLRRIRNLEEEGLTLSMRIAQVAPLHESVPRKYYGGTERAVSYLIEGLVRQSHEVTLFRSGDPATNLQCHVRGRCVWINVIGGETARNQKVSEAV